MKNTVKVGLVIGSLREGSYNRIVSEKIADLLPDNFEVTELKIDDLPFYNEDLDVDGKVPESWERLRKEVAEQDAYIFATPEYNRSVPAVLKNALDVASRPYGENKWAGKPALVTSVSIGGIGGFGANQHLRQSLVFLDVYPLQQPEVYMGPAAEFIEDGKVTNESTVEFLGQIADAFVEHVARFIDVD